MYQLKGINDDYDTCSLCGKTNLKKVAWLVELNEDGEEITDAAPYGTTCAANLLGARKSTAAGTRDKLYDTLIEALDTRVQEIWNNELVKFRGTYLPSDLIQPVGTGQMTMDAAIEERINRYPVLQWTTDTPHHAHIEKCARYL